MNALLPALCGALYLTTGALYAAAGQWWIALIWLIGAAVWILILSTEVSR